MLGLCCPTQILPPLPTAQLILLKAASEESKTVNTPPQPTPAAHRRFCDFTLKRRGVEWWETQGERVWFLNTHMWSPFPAPPHARREMGDLHLICIHRLCMSEQREDWCERTFNKFNKQRNTDVIKKTTLEFKDYAAALSQLCFLSFPDFPQSITIVLLLCLMIFLIISGLRGSL